jgi:outer membrane receptor protein involved in Fe transport
LQPAFLPTTDQETELSGRIDHSLTPKQGLMFRYAFTNTRNVNDAFHTDELTDRTARGSSFIADNSLNGTLTSTFAEDKLNKLHFELAQRRAVQRAGTSTGPGVLISGVALLGTPYSSNGRRNETHLEFANTLSLQHRQHLIQLGGRADRVALRASIGDGSQGFFVFPTLGSLQTGNADFFTQSFGNFDTNFTATRLSGFVQDHWTALPNLTLDYGLRYEYNRLPSAFSQDPVNFSPRFGLAWTPRNSLVIRSGFGIFFDRFQLSIINRILQKDGTRGFEQIVEETTAANLYRS